jgi:hypothetical protein
MESVLMLARGEDMLQREKLGGRSWANAVRKSVMKITKVSI